MNPMILKHKIGRNGVFATVSIIPYASVVPINTGDDSRTSGYAVATPLFDVKYRVEVTVGPQPLCRASQVPYRAEFTVPMDFYTGDAHTAVMHYAACVKELEREADWYEPKVMPACSPDPDARYAPVDPSYTVGIDIAPKPKRRAKKPTKTAKPATSTKKGKAK